MISFGSVNNSLVVYHIIANHDHNLLKGLLITPQDLKAALLMLVVMLISMS
jgi:hypothetical protein